MATIATRARDRVHALSNDSTASYWKDNTSNWFLYIPGSGVTQLTPTNTVTEHDDGTISLGAVIGIPTVKGVNTTINLKRGRLQD